MPPEQRRHKLNNKESGMLAEIIVSDPRYREALAAPFATEESSIATEEWHAQQESAYMILEDTVKEVGVHASPELREWEAGRNAVAALLSRRALGSFENYFLGVDSIPTVPEAQPEILPNGDYGVVGTNTRIVRYSNTINDPLEFLDTSLGVIDRRKKAGRDKIGPENYATTLKLFSDKYMSLERDNEEVSTETLTLPNVADMKQLVDETLQGLFEIAIRDKPNYVEMTNVYMAIRTLPKGLIDPKFTHDILKYTTVNMSQYDKHVARVFLGAVPKIDTSHYPLETSAIVNMMLHQEGEFETTRDLRVTIRAIDSLEKNPQTDAALRRFLELAEGFDQPLELEGIDEVVDRLHRIIRDNTVDAELSIRAKDFADKCMVRANRLTRQTLESGTLTQAQLEQLKQTYNRIKSNYQAL